MTVYILEIWDHSRLGGPMGTERDELMYYKLFSTEEKAIRYAIRQAMIYGFKVPSGRRSKIKKELADIGPLGFVFRKKKIV